MTTDELLSETVEEARQREQTTFDQLASAVGWKIVLFGAGTLGRKVLSALLQAGRKPLGFADNNPAIQRTRVDGVLVYSLDAAVQAWGNEALFVVTILHPFADRGMSSRLKQLTDLGCRWTTSFLPLSWMFTRILPHYGADLPSKILRQRQTLKEINSAWGDEASREIFRQQLSWRLRGDFSEIGPPSPNQYFPSDLIKPNLSEVFIDGGAFDGDTLRQIPWAISGAIAIEPDPVSVNKLFARKDDRVKIVEAVLGAAPGLTRFNASGTMAAARSMTGAIEIAVTTLDDILVNEFPTYLKLDVEGDELAALRGAEATLLRAQPAVAVCTYHRPEDFWILPTFLREKLPEHRFFVRIHANDGFELVVYALPHDRCVK